MLEYDVFFVFLGVLGLWWGSDYAVDAAKRIASSLKISEIVVGLTIASIGTSLPEIFTNLAAGYSTLHGEDASGIAIGNIIGSNLGQITIILGILGLLGTFEIDGRALRRNGLMMVMALLLMFLSCVDGHVSPVEGITLAGIYLLYLLYLIREEKVFSKVRVHEHKSSLLIDLIKVFLGIVAIIFSANLVVGSGVTLATESGVPESLIGIFVGLGTSIPELTVSLRALGKKQGHLSLGNLIGSNITDPLLSFGLGAAIAGVSVSSKVLYFDFPYWFFATVIALLLLLNHLDLNKKESTVLISLYLFFIYLRLMFLS